MKSEIVLAVDLITTDKKPPKTPTMGNPAKNIYKEVRWLDFRYSSIRQPFRLLETCCGPLDELTIAKVISINLQLIIGLIMIGQARVKNK